MTVTLVRPAGGMTRFGTLAPVRVRPVPSVDPPDDELDPTPTHVPTPTDFAASAPAPVAPAESGPVARPTGDGYRATRRYLDLALEVLGGFRPIGHLRPLTDPVRFEQVARQLTRLGGPPLIRPGSGLARVTGDRVRLRHVRLCEVHENLVEGAAVIARGESVRAMTLRLERRQAGAWLCTHLAVL
jgi:hypothetical protein